MAVGRLIINLLPILALTELGKINIKDFKIIRDFTNIKIDMPSLLATLLIGCLIIAVLMIYTLVMQPENSIDYDLFEGLPQVNGTIRVIDYLNLPSIYVLPLNGFNLELGSFRENNPQHFTKKIWSNQTEYINFLKEKNISYVLFCKICNPQSNEKEMLNNNFDKIWENNYYFLYNTGADYS